VLGHAGTTPTSILPGAKAFHAIRPLTVAEADALWPLLVLRTAVLIVSGAQQAALDPDNGYVTDQSDDEWRMFEQATSVPIDVMTGVVRAELGMATPVAAVAGAPLIAGLDDASVSTLDLSPTSDVFDSAFQPGAWPGPNAEDELARAAVADGASLVSTRFGEPRLTRAPALSQHSPEVVPTGVSLWPARAAAVTAPWAGEVAHVGAVLVLRGDVYELTVTGADVSAAAGHVDVGAPLATAAAGRWMHVGVRPVGAPAAPAFTTAELAPGWLALTRDPSALLGLSATAPAQARDLLARRDDSFAKVQEHYYRDPPQIERGWRHFLMSTSGRV
jgi:hypothetical protein